MGSANQKIQIPLVDLGATFEPIRKQLFDSFGQILESMNLFLGENVIALEADFTKYCEASFGLACSSGTDAVTLALMAFDFEPGFEAIVPAHTFYATIESVIHAGGVPVMVDIDPQTYCLDPTRIEAALSDRTAVIMPVHIYGHPADMDAINEIAKAKNLKVIEDAAQAHGSNYKGRKAGSLADAAAFSFYFTKNIGAFGETGFVTTRHQDVFERIKLLRHHGQSSKYEHAIVGYNWRPDELQAAVLRLKLPGLDENNARRREIAGQYTDSFDSLELVTPSPSVDVVPNYHCYVIQSDRRDELAHHLNECGIGTGIHYRIPGHLQPATRNIHHRAMPMPVTESVCSRCLTLPCYPELNKEKIEYLIESVKRFFAS